MDNGSVFEDIQTVKKQSGKQGEPWLLSYSDLVTNLMAIFILLFSMSTIDVSKFDTVTHEMTRRKTDSLDVIKKKIDEVIAKNKMQDEVRTELGVSGLRVIFQGSSMFRSASATLSPGYTEKMTPILAVFKGMDSIYQISLEGHTDDVPLRASKKFTDNWALSSARGVSLLQTLKGMGVPIERMSVAGYADTRPVVDPKTVTGVKLAEARALNRRVVIRVFQ